MYVDFSMYRYIYNRFAFRQTETVSAEERNGPRSSLFDSRTCLVQKVQPLGSSLFDSSASSQLRASSQLCVQ